MNEREISRLIRIVEESGIGELEIRRWWGGKRIRISKWAGAAPGPVTVNHASSPAAEPAPASANPALAPAPAATSTAEPAVEARYHTIRSPIVGTFYRAPAPEAPPYVQVGDVIKAGQTVCIVEAMKLMNEIQAELGGKVVRVLVENAQPVEYNQVLIVIDPEV
jgi:acetyl-CoA carboxylase biotin carboxyl carrier protein